MCAKTLSRRGVIEKWSLALIAQVFHFIIYLRVSGVYYGSGILQDVGEEVWGEAVEEREEKRKKKLGKKIKVLKIGAGFEGSLDKKKI